MPIVGFNTEVELSPMHQVDRAPGGDHEYCEISVDIGLPRFVSRAEPVSINIEVSVNNRESWVLRNQVDNEELRRHEQVHFDITAIAARDIEKRLMACDGARDMVRNKERIYRAVGRLLSSSNSLYDIQSRHGKDITAQTSWEQRIRAIKSNPDKGLTDLGLSATED